MLFYLNWEWRWIKEYNEKNTSLFVYFVFFFQKLIQHERQMREHEKTERKKLLNECNILHNQLQECHINLTTGNEHDLVVDSSSVADALDLLTTSDDRICLLLAEVPFMFFWCFCYTFIFHVFSIFNTCVQKFVFCNGNLEVLFFFLGGQCISFINIKVYVIFFPWLTSRIHFWIRVSAV